MPLNFIFRQPKNELEKGGRTPVAATSDLSLIHIWFIQSTITALVR